MPVAQNFGIYRRYYGFVRHALLRNNVAEADVDDAVHEVFIVLLRKLGTDADGEDLRAWLFEVSRRVASNQRRSARRHERKRRIAMPEPPLASVEEAVALREAAERLAGFVSSLDPADQTVFRMAEIEGAPGRKIAERLGVKMHVAYQRMGVVRERFESAFGVRPRRHGRLRSLLLFPLRWSTSMWSPALAASLLAAMVVPTPAPTPVRGDRAETIAARTAPEDRIEILETTEHPDEIVVLDAEEESARTRLGHNRRHRTEPLDDFETALAAALAPEATPRPPPRPPSLETAPSQAEREDRPPSPRFAPKRFSPEPKQVRAGLWTGRFVDADGKPLAGARVLCRRRSGSGIRRRCFGRSPAPRTDARGRVTIAFEPGTYELVAFAEGELRSDAEPKLVTIPS